MESHLLQMRGLKRCLSRIYRPPRSASHLLQMRGLKPHQIDRSGSNIRSHLLQMRGLKL